MIYERKCGVIVMLCSLTENGQVCAYFDVVFVVLACIYGYNTLLITFVHHRYRTSVTSTGPVLGRLSLENMLLNLLKKKGGRMFLFEISALPIIRCYLTEPCMCKSYVL